MIPVNEPLLNGREKQLLAECIDTGWVSSDGPFVKQFEQQFAGYIGARHGVAVCNGTAALEVALYAAGVGKGDEVITAGGILGTVVKVTDVYVTLAIAGNTEVVVQKSAVATLLPKGTIKTL